MEPLSTGATIGLAAGTQFLGGISSALGARRQYKYQSKLQQKAFDQNLQMWQMQNEYNTPQAQRERLEAAGYSPNLFAGQNSAGQGPTYTPPEAPNYGASFLSGSVDSANAIGTVTNLLQSREQLESMRLDNQMKAIDLELYSDDPHVKDAYNVPIKGDHLDPYYQGIARLRKSKLLQEFYNTERSAKLGSEFERDERRQALQFLRERGMNLGYQNRELASRIGLRKLDTQLRKLEVDWFNSSRFMKNIAPFLNLLRKR